MIEDLDIQDVKPIHPKKLPANRKEMTESKKTHLSLRDSYERDLVVSYTSNLEFPARLDIVVPKYLQPLRVKLESLAYRVRKHARDTDDKKVMTSLRLDDMSVSLVMAVREEKKDPWLYYSYSEHEEEMVRCRKDRQKKKFKQIEDLNRRRRQRNQTTVPGKTKMEP